MIEASSVAEELARASYNFILCDCCTNYTRCTVTQRRTQGELAQRLQTILDEHHAAKVRRQAEERTA